VVEFSAAGTYKKTIGHGYGDAKGQLHTPSGVAVGLDGNLYVLQNYSDIYGSNPKGRISVFDPVSGELVRAFYSDPGVYTQSMAIDSNSYLWASHVDGDGWGGICFYDIYGNYFGYTRSMSNSQAFQGGAFQVSFDSQNTAYIAYPGRSSVIKLFRCEVTLTATPTPVITSTPCISFNLQWSTELFQPIAAVTDNS
jgi:hypothetical protein